MRLEDLARGTMVKGILPDTAVTIIDVTWYGTAAVEITYKDNHGQTGQELLYRDREPALELVSPGQTWQLDADGAKFRLVSEAHRIKLAHLFDPMLAIHTSEVEPLPHQITAVYGEMLPRQPLRYLLADDPGAGKTIMAGLLIRELIIRGDLKRCLICAPGGLVEQWQDELSRRFQLTFAIISRQAFQESPSGNPFQEKNLVLCRLDHLSRNEEVQEKLKQTDWDLIIVDEAHKMSASFFGGEVKATKRYRLGKLLSALTRHFLLMTATPHNGKEEDFQLFMALLDGDRFEGKFRDGVHMVDTSDLMRRMVKEQLLKFDGTPLFPERRAYTVTYQLSDQEAALYRAVTKYVREEWDRADALENEGRKGTVGFALTILQRRLASSPEAIYQSLCRRRERLEKRLRDEKINKRGASAMVNYSRDVILSADEIEDIEDFPGYEDEEMEEQIVDQATAARTIEELEAEILTLKKLERMAKELRQSGSDKKWEELSGLLHGRGSAKALDQIFDQGGHRRKLVIFTEQKDTLKYLQQRITTLWGREDGVVTIHGSMGREDRKKAQERFNQDKNVHILIATDAAGEGINLQRAHLMVNYDIPWNPNRLEQRFGRIHRIGQTEVCHLWNLVAEETREGDVFIRLLSKLENIRESLGGAVFDVLGKVFQGTRLRQLLMDAIRYGEKPEVRASLEQAVESALDREQVARLLEERALARESMDISQVLAVKEEMERAQARRLQPHFIAAFFLEAFKLLGGRIREREPRRYEITHVPAIIRQRDRQIGTGVPVLTRYERVCFEKGLIHLRSKPPAEFICPGHPLLDSVVDIIEEQYRGLFKQGTVFIDEKDPGTEPRALIYLEHSVVDGRIAAGGRRVVSRQMQFVEIDRQNQAHHAGYAPYLDYRPITTHEVPLIQSLDLNNWLRDTLENASINYAIGHMVPNHLAEVKQRKEELVNKTIMAVKDRLTKEIAYWDHRAEELLSQEQAGKVNARLNSANARRRADELQARLTQRLKELEQEKQLAPLPPVVTGGALVIPAGLLASLKGETAPEPGLFARETRVVEQLAMQAVMEQEIKLGYEPRDVAAEKCGYDIESKIPGTGKLRFIEVKGRVAGARTVTVTKNEILTALNKPEDFILAVVTVENNQVAGVVYITQPFNQQPDFAVTSVNYDLNELLSRGERLA
ncbi:helicase-related protein [Desulfallas thermosapovorans]|uniref:SNF2 domain-containing protein n=1 Tax=Desulfallas thermosapovorans DSM 6562 TaxID=1121431 RepID=A0A5S4ZNL7_9FIRM|nr:helicase-related protein [Desulfallas thermosapovorans]TYO92796.1 SNF2 domain-containing protein [Desulfallas thermosapovorans DSM 6562]